MIALFEVILYSLNEEIGIVMQISESANLSRPFPNSAVHIC